MMKQQNYYQSILRSGGKNRRMKRDYALDDSTMQDGDQMDVDEWDENQQRMKDEANAQSQGPINLRIDNTVRRQEDPSNPGHDQPMQQDDQNFQSGVAVPNPYTQSRATTDAAAFGDQSLMYDPNELVAETRRQIQTQFKVKTEQQFVDPASVELEIESITFFPAETEKQYNHFNCPVIKTPFTDLYVARKALIDASNHI